LDKQSIIDVYRQVYANITNVQQYGLNFKNLLVLDENVDIQPVFEDAVINSFETGLMKESFHTKSGAEKATSDVNAWINEITQGKISKLFDENLGSDTSAVLANAFHFKSAWLSPFDPQNSYVGPFTMFNGQQKDVTYMKISKSALKNARFSRNFGFRNVEIPFEGPEGRLWFGIMFADGGNGNFGCCSEYTRKTNC